MGELIIENESPPSKVMGDVRALKNVIKVKRLRVEAGPNEQWTIHIRDRTDEEKFNTIADLFEDTVTSDDVRRVYNPKGRDDWLVQARYDP